MIDPRNPAAGADPRPTRALRRFHRYLLRYVPHLVRDESIDLAIIVTEDADDGFAEMFVRRDWRPLTKLDPNFDQALILDLLAELRAGIVDADTREQTLAMMLDSFSNMLQIEGPESCVVGDQESLDRLASLHFAELCPGKYGPDD